MKMQHHIDCPKPNCGFSTEGNTQNSASARMFMHLQRNDHAAELKAWSK